MVAYTWKTRILPLLFILPSVANAQNPFSPETEARTSRKLLPDFVLERASAEDLPRIHAALAATGLTLKEIERLLIALNLQGKRVEHRNGALFVGEAAAFKLGTYQVGFGDPNSGSRHESMSYVSDMVGGQLTNLYISDGRVIFFPKPGSIDTYWLVVRGPGSPQARREYQGQYVEGNLRPEDLIEVRGILDSAGKNIHLRKSPRGPVLLASLLKLPHFGVVLHYDANGALLASDINVLSKGSATFSTRFVRNPKNPIEAPCLVISNTQTEEIYSPQGRRMPSLLPQLDGQRTVLEKDEARPWSVHVPVQSGAESLDVLLWDITRTQTVVDRSRSGKLSRRVTISDVLGQVVSHEVDDDFKVPAHK